MMKENSDHKSSPKAPARADMTSDDNSGSSTDNFEVREPPRYKRDSSRKLYNDGPKNTCVPNELSPNTVLKSQESDLAMMRENSDHKSSPRAPARADITSGDSRGPSSDSFEVREPPDYRGYSSWKPYSNRTEDSEDDGEQEKERIRTKAEQ